MAGIMGRHACWLALAGFTFGLLGCIPRVHGSGNLETRALELSDFTRIEVSHAFEAVVERADGFLVEVSLDDNLMQHLRAEVVQGTLRIGMQGKRSYDVQDGHMRVRIRLPRLEALEASGAVEVELLGFGPGGAEPDDFRLGASGASELRGEIAARRLEIDLSGASELRLGGRAERLEAEVSGASELHLEELQVVAAEVDLSGASEAEVAVSARLAVDASGASSLSYHGQPLLERVETSGASSVERADTGSALPAEAPPAAVPAEAAPAVQQVR